MKYSEKTLAYYNNIQNMGALDNEDIHVGTGMVGSPLCGDVMKLQLLFDDNDKIESAKYKVFGCVSAIASMEYICALLKGKTIEEAKKIENREVANSLELTPIKRHCSVLAKEAIESAIENYLKKKNGQNTTKMISLSEAAASKIKALIATGENECVGIGITVDYGSCSGILYSLSYENEATINNKEKIVIDEILFYYAKDDELMLDGVCVDVLDDDTSDGFVVKNKRQFSCCANCTCGRSSQ